MRGCGRVVCVCGGWVGWGRRQPAWGRCICPRTKALAEALRAMMPSWLAPLAHRTCTCTVPVPGVALAFAAWCSAHPRLLTSAEGAAHAVGDHPASFVTTNGALSPLSRRNAPSGTPDRRRWPALPPGPRNEQPPSPAARTLSSSAASTPRHASLCPCPCPCPRVSLPGGGGPTGAPVPVPVPVPAPPRMLAPAPPPAPTRAKARRTRPLVAGDGAATAWTHVHAAVARARARAWAPKMAMLCATLHLRAL